MKKPLNDHKTTRIIPGLTASYQIVSLPYWAWFWLEDFMKKNKISYRGIYDTFGQQGDFGQTLHQIAELHHDYAMRERYNLANDNEPDDRQILVQLKHKIAPPRSLVFPKIYKIFGFMPSVTHLTSVWDRKNHRDSLKIN